MTDIIQIIKAAEALGINVTAAELGTELCNAWIDRVAAAKTLFDKDDMAGCQEMIDEANSYAI